MAQITIGRRLFETPVLIPSISSFETQLKPPDALRLQIALQEPISLVSAYDVFHDESQLVQLCTTFRRHGVILLDSGGYESSRISRYAGDEPQRWSFENYVDISSKDIYDLIFSFDYFLSEHESVNEFSDRIMREFRQHSNFIDMTKLIPVVHIQTADGKRYLDEASILQVFGTVTADLNVRFVAVAERELGPGVVYRANLVNKIVQTVKERSRSCALHILGCGNLLSFSLFSVAGAIMCDGLEWCRTYAATNFHLHHFQQRDLFPRLEDAFDSPISDLIFGTSLPYQTTAAGHNLLNFQVFANEIQGRLGRRTVHELVSANFGTLAGDAVRTLEL
jgi:queuine/archaeosine tRNA-ribosyltransferase